MCNLAAGDFGVFCLTKKIVFEKRILEVGACNINGSIKPHVMTLNPTYYHGVDIQKGQYVDEVIDANNLIEHFGVDSFDVILTTEMMEHIENWRNVINNLKGVCRANGYILITTRSRGFGYHGYPHDYWRYEESDMRKIFADFDILEVGIDPEWGILIFVKKPINWIPIDLSTIELYDIRTELNEPHPMTLESQTGQVRIYDNSNFGMEFDER